MYFFHIEYVKNTYHFYSNMLKLHIINIEKGTRKNVQRILPQQTKASKRN